MFSADPTDHQATTLAAVGPSVHEATAITCRIVPVTTMIPLELMDVAPVILFLFRCLFLRPLSLCLLVG